MARNWQEHLCEILSLRAASIEVTEVSKRLIWVVVLSLLPIRLCLADTDTRPIIVLRVDDCSKTWRNVYPEFGGTNALGYGKSKHIPITWGIITRRPDPNSLTWDELRDYLNTAGGEPASHSVLHAKQTTTQEYIDELVASKEAINANLGPTYSCTTFIQPGVWKDDADMNRIEELYNPIGQAIQDNYDQSMAYLFGGWTVGDTYYKYGAGCPLALDYSSTLSETSVQASLDVIEHTPGLVYVVTCHMIQATGGTIAYAVPANIMKYFMDHAASLRDEGKIRLMSLRDAYSQTFPSDLNRIPNPAFEISTPGYSNPCVPWRALWGASIVDGQGIDGSRSGRVAGLGARLQNDGLVVPPGRYELNWSQNCEPNYPLGSPLMLVLVNMVNPSSGTAKSAANYAYFYCANRGTWETRRCLLKVRDRLPCLSIAFQVWTAFGVRIDDVSLVEKAVDPGTCPSNLSWTIDPTGGTLSWDTPADPSITTIYCRYGERTHPLSASEGVSLGSIAAIPGTRQEMPFSMNWASPSLYGIYCSVFAVGSGGDSDLDIDYLVIDRTPPTITCSAYVECRVPVELGRKATVTWSSSDAESSVHCTRYAVGRGPGGSDVVPWTDAQASPLILDGLPENGSLHLSMQAQNRFGLWSSLTDCVLGNCGNDISSALSQPDGTEVTVNGTVSAVFGDSFYVEQPDRARGVRICGGAVPIEGESVAVFGILATVNGERVVNID